MFRSHATLPPRNGISNLARKVPESITRGNDTAEYFAKFGQPPHANIEKGTMLERGICIFCICLPHCDNSHCRSLKLDTAGEFRVAK